MYVQPVDVSTHGHSIDEQLADTMAESIQSQALRGSRENENLKQHGGLTAHESARSSTQSCET